MTDGPFLIFECVNCGRKAWSLKEIVKCSVCGATVVCTHPKETAPVGKLASSVSK